MTQKLTDFLNKSDRQQYATSIGTDMHLLMQQIVIDKSGDYGNSDIVNIIKKHVDLLPFFTATAQTEVPVAGKIKGIFVSRRIDRLSINHDDKNIDFIDYKTDTNKTEFIEKYKYQLKEYHELLHSAYPDYKINGYILWLHDWTLDKII